MLKSAGLILISQVVNMGVLFLRNVLIARLISVEDFGIAVNFAIAFAFLENATYVGLQRMIVQDREGDNPRFQYALHLFQVIRGVIAMAVGLVLAGYYASFLDIPELAWTFMVLATLPFIRSFLHLDIYRYQRQMNFLPEVALTIVAPIFSLLVALGVYFISADYQMMLWAIIAQQILQIILSHVMAERPFGLVWDMVVMQRALRFGLPLLINGLLLFAFANGERVLIGGQLGLEVLGWFSAGFMMVQALASLIKRVVNPLMLPKMSAQTENVQLVYATLQLSMVLGVGLMLGTVLIGPSLLLVAFGAEYAPALTVLGLLGLVQMLNILKSGVAVTGMSRGDTLISVYPNLPSLVTLPLGFFLLQADYGLVPLLYLGVLGEIAGLVIAFAMLRSKHHVSLRPLQWPALIFALSALGAMWIETGPFATPGVLAWADLGVVLLGVALCISSRALWRYGRSWWQQSHR